MSFYIFLITHLSIYFISFDHCVKETNKTIIYVSLNTWRIEERPTSIIVDLFRVLYSVIIELESQRTYTYV